MYQRFKFDRGTALSINLTTLIELSFGGDLEGFLAAWDYTLMAMKAQPDEALHLALLDIQLRKCKAFGPAYIIFDGLYNAARQEVIRK